MTQDQGNVSPGFATTRSAVGDELSHDASQLKSTATQRMQQEADTRKGQAAQIAGSASSALGKAAEELEQDDNAPDWLGSAMRQAAGSIDRLASEVDGRSVNQLGQQLTSFARSNPGAFLAASAAAGFAAARVLRAGVEHRHHSQGSSDFGGAGGSTSTTSTPGAASYGTASSSTPGGTGMGSGTGTGSAATTGASTFGMGTGAAGLDRDQGGMP